MKSKPRIYDDPFNVSLWVNTMVPDTFFPMTRLGLNAPCVLMDRIKALSNEGWPDERTTRTATGVPLAATVTCTLTVPSQSLFKAFLGYTG